MLLLKVLRCWFLKLRSPDPTDVFVVVEFDT